MSFKLRPDELDLLRKLAQAAGIGPSSFAAEAVRAALGTARRRPLPRRVGEISQAIREATGQLGRIGNNLNQVARVLNSGGRPDLEALIAIRAELATIDARLSEALAS